MHEYEVEEILVKVLQYFSTLQSPKSLRIPLHLSFSRAHDFFLNRILLAPHFERYPPSKDYQYTFWKWAIHFLENLPRGEACTLCLRT